LFIAVIIYGASIIIGIICVFRFSEIDYPHECYDLWASNVVYVIITLNVMLINIVNSS